MNTHSTAKVHAAMWLSLSAGLLPPSLLAGQTTEARPRIIAADEGFSAVGENGFITLIKVGSVSTGASQLYVGSGVVPPNTETPTHLHEVDEEVLYVVEGEITLTLNGQVHTVATGGTAFIPPGTWMKVANKSDAPARVIGILPRGDVEKCFRAIYPAAGYYKTEADRTADFAFCKTRMAEDAHGQAEVSRDDLPAAPSRPGRQ
jgi:quercetin dioxygenase-like cupin family protein